MRPIVYPHTDIFLVCFSVVMPASLMNIQNQWVHEITKYCPNTPFILVGLLINTQQYNYIRLFVLFKLLQEFGFRFDKVFFSNF